MTPFRIAPFVLATALGAAGCTAAPAVCECPIGGLVLFNLPAARTNPIVSVSADPPCTAMDSGAGGVTLSRSDSGICRGSAVLSNGDTYAFSVEFRPSGTGCCGGVAFPIDASPPTLIDGGQD